MGSQWTDSVLLAKQRFQWALRRISDFNLEANAFIGTGKYAVVEERRPDGKDRIEVVYTFRAVGSPPANLRFIAGDAIHNLRAVVDNLLWSIGQKYGAGDRLAAVFYKRPDDFRKYAKSQNLDRLPAPILDWFVSEQPYNRPNEKPSVLGRINDLWGADKHRAPLLLGSADPEGFIEAFANIYRSVADRIIALRAASPSMADFPTVEDGARGVRFIERVLQSSRHGATWVAW